MNNGTILLTTFKNNRVFNSILKTLKTEYEVKEDRTAAGDKKVYKIEIPEDFIPIIYGDYVIRSIKNELKNFPDNYIFSVGNSPELGFIFSFYIQIEGREHKVLFSHKIREVKK